MQQTNNNYIDRANLVVSNKHSLSTHLHIRIHPPESLVYRHS